MVAALCLSTRPQSLGPVVSPLSLRRRLQATGLSLGAAPRAALFLPPPRVQAALLRLRAAQLALPLSQAALCAALLGSRVLGRSAREASCFR